MNMQKTGILRKLLPGLVLGFIVFVALALLGDLRQVRDSLLQFRWEYFFIALGFTLINYTLRFFKWHFYINQVGARNLSLWQSLRMFIAGFPLAVTPGKVGEVFKGVWLNRTSSIPVGRGVSVVLAERISDGMAVMLLSMLGIMAFPQFWPAFILILVFLLLIIIISQIRPLAVFFLDLGEKMPFVNRFALQLREFYEGSYSLFRPGAAVFAILLGCISWLCEGIGLYFILVGLGPPPGFKLLGTAVFVLAFSIAIGAASAMPGGLGATEGTIAVLLPLALNIQPAVAASATLLIRMATLWFGVGLGLLMWTFSMDLLGLRSDPKSVVDPGGSTAN
jgi:glycosyltransferase 2 family protein